MTSSEHPAIHRIVNIKLDQGKALKIAPEVESERQVAIRDLLEENSFVPASGITGPYKLELRMVDSRIEIDVISEPGELLERYPLPLGPFRSLIRDYFMVCNTYYEALKGANPQQIEALDMGRRAIHNEASELLIEKLEDKVTVDQETARRLFTLICVQQIRG